MRLRAIGVVRHEWSLAPNASAAFDSLGGEDSETFGSGDPELDKGMVDCAGLAVSHFKEGLAARAHC